MLNETTTMQPHPAPQRIAWGVCALFAVLLVWTIVCEVDVVVTAPGRVVASTGEPGAPLSAEVVIDHKDIGLIAIGQQVNIKLQAFPFEQHGVLDARVSRVTSHTFIDQKGTTPIFPATLALGADSIQVDGKRVPLTPGMSLTAEITVGKRLLIDDLLMPVQTAMGGSL